MDVSKICVGAYNGEEALAIFKQDVESIGQNRRSRFKLIFMDCNMPKMDGYECTGAIRSFIHERGLDQPIIVAITGHTE